MASRLSVKWPNEVTEALELFVQFISSRVSLFEAFQRHELLVFSKRASPNSRMNLKNKGMNRSGRKRGRGRWRAEANPITVAAK